MSLIFEVKEELLTLGCDANSISEVGNFLDGYFSQIEVSISSIHLTVSNYLDEQAIEQLKKNLLSRDCISRIILIVNEEVKLNQYDDYMLPIANDFEGHAWRQNTPTAKPSLVTRSIFSKNIPSSTDNPTNNRNKEENVFNF